MPIGYRGPADHPSRRGLELGIEEANVQGAFLGWRFELLPLESETPDTAAPDTGTRDTGTSDTATSDATEVLAEAAALGEDALRALTGRGRLILNLASADDALRAECRADLLHLLPSQSALRRAEAGWRGARAKSSAAAAAWHPDFVKYAARDLNARFVKRFGSPMDAQAWAGWAAGRLLAEAVLRSGSPEPAALRSYLRDELAFDGQKGTALRFDSSGQLLQPVLLVEDGRIVGEFPSSGGELDALAAPACAAGERD